MVVGGRPAEAGIPAAPGRFSVDLTINYEDTDAGGVVYYANYLAYMERARNAFLRQLGFPLSQLVRDHGMVFVVTEADLRYLSPARLDDHIRVTLEITRAGGASVEFGHEVLRDDQVLVRGRVRLAVVDAHSGRPKRIPSVLGDLLLARDG